MRSRGIAVALAVLIIAGVAGSAMAGPNRAGGIVSPGRVVLKVCRVPGAEVIGTDPVINIAVGTKFDDAEALSEEQTVGRGPSQRVITVATTERSSITAQAFCVDVPAKIVGGPSAGELVGDCARMFTASGAAGVDLGLFPLAMTYALLKPRSNGSADEAGLGSRGVN